MPATQDDRKYLEELGLNPDEYIEPISQGTNVTPSTLQQPAFKPQATDNFSSLKPLLETPSNNNFSTYGRGVDNSFQTFSPLTPAPQPLPQYPGVGLQPITPQEKTAGVEALKGFDKALFDKPFSFPQVNFSPVINAALQSPIGPFRMSPTGVGILEGGLNLAAGAAPYALSPGALISAMVPPVAPVVGARYLGGIASELPEQARQAGASTTKGTEQEIAKTLTELLGTVGFGALLGHGVSKATRGIQRGVDSIRNLEDTTRAEQAKPVSEYVEPPQKQLPGNEQLALPAPKEEVAPVTQQEVVKPTTPVEPTTLTPRQEIDNFKALQAELLPEEQARTEGGLTTKAYKLGQSITDRSDLDAIVDNYIESTKKTDQFMEEGDSTAAINESVRAQTWSEAYGAATETGSAGELLRRDNGDTYNPTFKGELPIEEAAQKRQLPATPPEHFTTALGQELSTGAPYEVAPNKKTGTIDMLSLRGKMRKSAAGEEKVLADLGMFKDLGSKAKAEDIQKWLAEKGPKLEVKKLSAEDVNKNAQKMAQLRHELDTAGWYPTRDAYGKLEILNRSNERFTEVTDATIPEDIRRKLVEWERLDRIAGSSEEFITDSATARYTMVNPKPLNEMSGAVDILVRVPQQTSYSKGKVGIKHLEEPKFEGSHFGESDKNIVGWTRGYMETLPDGKKVFHVFELQSDWGQTVRKQQNEIQRRAAEGLQTRGERDLSDPTLDYYESLALKAAIRHAVEQGADYIAISDSKTAMMTEGHDKAAKSIQKLLGKDLDSVKSLSWYHGKFERFGDDYKDGIYAYIKRSGDDVSGSTLLRIDKPRLNYENQRELASELAKEYPNGEGLSTKGNIVVKQQKGMETNYDVKYPSLLKSLTKSVAQDVEFPGKHQNGPSEAFEGKSNITGKMFSLDRIKSTVLSEPARMFTEQSYGQRLAKDLRDSINRKRQLEKAKSKKVIEAKPKEESTQYPITLRGQQERGIVKVGGSIEKYDFYPAPPDDMVPPTLSNDNNPGQKQLPGPDKLQPEVLRHEGYSFHPWLTSMVDKIAQSERTHTSMVVTDQFHKFFGLARRTYAAYYTGLQDAFRGLTRDEQNLVAAHNSDMDTFGKTKIKLYNDKLRKASEQVTAIFRAIRKEANDRGIRVKTENGLRLGGMNPDGYWPNNAISTKVIDEWTQRPESNLSKSYDQEWINHVKQFVKKSEPGEIEKMLLAYKLGLGSHYTTTIDFPALRRAQGYGLPRSLQATDVQEVLHRYVKKVADDFAFYETVQRHPEMRKALNIPDQEGNFIDPATYTHINPIRHSVHVERVMRHILGLNRPQQPNVVLAMRLVNNMLMGPLTAFRNVANMPAFLTSQMTPLDFKHALKALMVSNEVRQRALANGAIRRDFRNFDIAFGDSLDGRGPLNTVKALEDLLSRNLRKYQGRDLSDQIEGLFYFSIGQLLAHEKIAAAKAGDKNAERFMAHAGDLVPGGWRRLLKQGEKVTQNDIEAIATRFVDMQRGTYSPEGLPHYMVEGPMAPWLSLGRFSTEKANRTYKDVVVPLVKHGNAAPLLFYIFGGLLTGAAIQELSQLLNNKKLSDPSWKELLAAGDTSDWIAKLTSIAQAATTFGILGDFVKAGVNVTLRKQGLRFNNPMTMPFATFIGDTIGQNIAEMLKAWQESTTAEEGLNALWEGAKSMGNDSLQSLRMLNNWLDEDETLRKDRFRDRRIYDELTHDKVRPFIGGEDKFSNLPVKEYKRETDIGKAVEMLPGLIDRAVQKSIDKRTGEIDVKELEKQLRGIKQNSYQTMPSFTENPVEFANFYNYLVKTQGPEKAYATLMNYIQQNKVNEEKSKLVPKAEDVLKSVGK